MGVKASPDIFKSNMYELSVDIPNIQVYLDDVLITSTMIIFEEHAAIMEKVLERLQKANFRANLSKCYVSEPKIDYTVVLNSCILSRARARPQIHRQANAP
jgi:hypothetical protein